MRLAHRLRTGIVRHYVRYRLGLDEAGGYATPAERGLLCQLAATAQTIVEIGAFEGVTTRAIREAMPPDARLYAVDPFPPNRFGFNVQHGIFWSEVNRSANGRVILLRQYSYQAIASWREPIDLIFLDADQSFEGVTRDFRAWGTHVRRGGFILISTSEPSAARHTSELTWNGPYRLVHEVLPHEPGFRIVRAVDSTTVVVRN